MKYAKKIIAKYKSEYLCPNRSFWGEDLGGAYAHSLTTK